MQKYVVSLQSNNKTKDTMKAITLEEANRMTEWAVKTFTMGYPVALDYVTITVKDIDDFGKVTYFEKTYKLIK